MALSPDVVRQVEQDLLVKADVLAYHIGNLVVTDAERARAVYEEIVARLRNAVSPAADLAPKSELLSLDRRPSVRLAKSGGDEIEDFILDILAHSPRGLSVQEIVDGLVEAEIVFARGEPPAAWRSTSGRAPPRSSSRACRGWPRSCPTAG